MARLFGQKTEEPSSKYTRGEMIRGALFVLLVLISHVQADTARYWKSGRETLATSIEELKHQITLLRNDLRNQEIEVKKVQEKTQSTDQILASLEEEIATVLKEVKQQSKGPKALQQEINAIKKNIAKNEAKTLRLEKSLEKNGTDLETIESALSTMMDALGIKDEALKIYTVKPGDSLGEIAMKHRTSVSHIKKVNHLKSDKIIVGQKLKMP